MKQADKELSEILSLVTELKEGTILPERFSRLDEILSTDPRARKQYIEIIWFYVHLEFLFKENSISVSFPESN